MRQTTCESRLSPFRLESRSNPTALAGFGRSVTATPILDEFKTWLDRELETGRILPKRVIRSAFTYTMNQ